MIAPPRHYAEWVAALDRFAAGDDEVLAAMEAGTLEWTAGVGERFTRRTHEALFARMNEVQRRLQRDLDFASGRDDAVSRALVGARRGAAPLVRLARLAVLPAEVRTHLEGEIERLLSSMQSSLEACARGNRQGGDRVWAALRASPLRLPPGDEHPAESGVSPPAAPAAAGARRSILLP